MFHVNAWGVPFAAAMIGAKLVFPGPHLAAEDLLDIMQSEEVTLALGVPTIWMAIQQALDREPERWKLAPRHADDGRRLRRAAVADRGVRAAWVADHSRLGHDRDFAPWARSRG